MILSAGQKIEVVLGGAVATNELPIAVAWADTLDDASTFAPNTTLTQTSGITAVDALAAPASGTKRQLKYLSIFNADTVSATVTVRVDVSGTKTILTRVPLLPDYRLEYTFSGGWRVLTSDGSVRGAGTPGADGADGVGVPPGGTTGQVLAKASAADYDTAWVDQTGGGGGSSAQDFILQAFGVT